MIHTKRDMLDAYHDRLGTPEKATLIPMVVDQSSRGERSYDIYSRMLKEVEPLVRARAGLVSREEACAGLVRGFPNGQPAAGDRGLDRTRTWGRVYWGGAPFFFEADYAIRAATNGKNTLLSALGAMVRAGFVNGSPASLEAAFAEGDREVGASVLVPMLARYGVTPEAFPYERHLEELGVRPSGERVSRDATASRAAWLGAF